MRTIIRCDRCGAQNADGTTNCMVCGTAIMQAPQMQQQPYQQPRPGHQPQQSYTARGFHQQPQQQHYQQQQPKPKFQPPRSSTITGAPPPPNILNAMNLGPGEAFVTCWRADYLPHPDSQGNNGILVSTNKRVMFIVELTGHPPSYQNKFAVKYSDIRDISVSGFFSKQLTISGATNNSPWSLNFKDAYDVDQASFRSTSKVQLSWLQGYLLELRGKSYR